MLKITIIIEKNYIKIILGWNATEAKFMYYAMHAFFDFSV